MSSVGIADTRSLIVPHIAEGPEPEYKPLSEYPEWLARIVDEKPLILEDYIMRGLENTPSVSFLAMPPSPINTG